jgi:hypothetical protein
MRPLYKTTIIIWSEYDPSATMEIDDIAREAMDGDSYCSKQDTVRVDDPSKDDNAPDMGFFGDDEDDDEEDPDEEDNEDQD